MAAVRPRKPRKRSGAARAGRPGGAFGRRGAEQFPGTACGNGGADGFFSGLLIGAAKRRRSLVDAVDNHGVGKHATDLAAAINDLARGAQEVILAVPDLPGFNEAAQRVMIDAARKSHARSVRLLWRPVAAMLSLIAEGRLGQAHLDKRFRFLIHGAHGIEDQILMLREDPVNRGHIAPQRDSPGGIWAEHLGPDALFDRADRAVRAANPINWDRFEPSRLGPRLVVGEATPLDQEVLRNKFDWWQVVTAPDLQHDALFPSGAHAPASEAPCAGTFLVTPLEKSLAARLVSLLGPGISIQPHGSVARGCLRAGRLIEKGLPHYFDRLEAIRIAALREGEPAFVPLIPDGHLVAAKQE